MGIVRSRPAGNFLTLPNEVIRDRRISLEALGGLAVILSHPRGWEVRVSHVERVMFGCGRERRRRIFLELERAGYMHRAREHDPETGRLVWIYEFCDEPNSDGNYDRTIDGLPVDGSPVGGSPVDGSPTPLIKNDSLNTNKKNTHTTTVAVSDEICLEFTKAMRSSQIQIRNPSGYLKSLVPFFRGAITENQVQAALARGRELLADANRKKNIAEEIRRQQTFANGGDSEARARLTELRRHLGRQADGTEGI